MSAPIFISHTSNDQKIAELICDALQSRGYPCWIACRNIAAGENVQEAVAKAIRFAKLMLLVVTSGSENSDEIKYEVDLASRHRLAIVPFRFENVVPEVKIEQIIAQIGDSPPANGPYGDWRTAIGAGSISQDRAKTIPTERKAVLFYAMAAVVLLGICSAFVYTLMSRANEAPSSGTRRFDGTWVTILSCSKTATALGYSYKFDSRIKDGIFHGQRGNEGEPGWITFDGALLPDGSAELHARGLTGQSAYSAGTTAAGTVFSYLLRVKFELSSGTGSREEGRPCIFTALKQ
jgi:hypothetical protein